MPLSRTFGFAGVASKLPFRGILRPAVACLTLIWIIDTGVGPVRAEIKMNGSPEALQVDVVDAKLAEVLSELKAKFGLRYRANDTLDRRITGTFHGSLHRVMVRLLEGYDYVITISPRGLDALILLQSATAAAVPQPPALSRSSAPSVRTAQEAKRGH